MIVKNFKWIMCLPAGIVVIGLIFALIFGGLNLGIDFTGGSIITVNMGGTFNSEDVRAAVSASPDISGAVSVVSSGDGMTQAVIRVQESGDKSSTDSLVDSIMQQINAKWPGATFGGRDSVGAIASSELIANAIYAVLIASVLILLYIWWRFELYSGIGAVLAVVHDIIVMTAVMAIFRVTIDSAFIAACLTIIGYSINDTVILFDRMRENLATLNPREITKAQIIDRSVKETLGRTINTSVTTLIMIVCLYVFGVQTIKDFAFPIIIGIVAGTFSSIFVAAPIWILMAEKFAHKKKTGVKVIS